MPTSIPDSNEAGVDPDDAPRLTREFFDSAEIREGGRLVRADRARGEPPREQISVRLDAEVLAKLREHGPGWQSRMNPLLRQALGLNGAAAPAASTEMCRVLEEITLLRREMAHAALVLHSATSHRTDPTNSLAGMTEDEIISREARIIEEVSMVKR